MGKVPSQLSESQIRAVLDRALALDAERSERLSITHLRDVATEVGISPESLELALSEHFEVSSEYSGSSAADERPLAPLLWSRFKHWWRRRDKRFDILAAILGAALGSRFMWVLDQLVRSNSVVTPGMAAWAVVTAAALFIALRRGRGVLANSLFLNLLFFCGFGLLLPYDLLADKIMAIGSLVGLTASAGLLLHWTTGLLSVRFGPGSKTPRSGRKLASSPRETPLHKKSTLRMVPAR